MRLHIEESSIRFFHENGSIVFEHFFTEEKGKLLLKEAKQFPIEGFLQNETLKKTLNTIQLGSCLHQMLRKNHFLLGICRLVEEKECAISRKLFSLHPIECFIYLQLDGIASAPFPMQSGDAIFIDPRKDFLMEQNGIGLLIGVGTLKTQYRQNLEDPNTNLLKKYGYAFGDRLDVKTHPLLK